MTIAPLETIAIHPAGPIRHAVIWLHGLGADGHDFEPIVPELGLTERFGIRFLFPHAPYQPITVNGGYLMRAWYDIAEMEIGSRPDLAGIGRSVQAVTALLEDEVARGLASSRIVLAGFSQGGLIALEAGARFRLPLAGIIALSTYLADPPGFPPARGGMPVFMGHGRFDDLVPHELGRQSRDELIARGYRVTWKDYAIPHSVCAEEIGDIAAWLAVLLEADDSS